MKGTIDHYKVLTFLKVDGVPLMTRPRAAGKASPARLCRLLTDEMSRHRVMSVVAG